MVRLEKIGRDSYIDGSTMNNKFGTIKNPLTIIAIFAGISEISGTVVLPALGEHIQETFIWFVMIFPFALISCFFLVLTFKHHVLYAPSDYKDDANFLRAKSTAQANEYIGEPNNTQQSIQI